MANITKLPTLKRNEYNYYFEVNEEKKKRRKRKVIISKQANMVWFKYNYVNIIAIIKYYEW